MAAAKLTVHEDFVLSGYMSVDGGIAAGKFLVSKGHRPTAIFCANDEMAFGAMHAVQKSGLKVPEDVSIMGFDDTRYAAVANPPLSTVAQPAREIGETVARRMLEELDNAGQANNLVNLLPHRLVVRQSTGKAPG